MTTITQPEWNDLKVFLELARSKKISVAGEKLGVEHSTVSRRVDRLEKSLNTVLFDRRRDGYSLTDAGVALIPYAERMEAAMLSAMDESAGRAAGISGTVRVGTPEAFGIKILAPNLLDLYRRYPKISVELMAQPQFPSLVTREVEILVTMEPPRIGRYTAARLAEVDYYLYGSPEYLKQCDPIKDLSDVANHWFLDYIHDGAVSERYKILDELTKTPNRRFTSTSVLAQKAAAVAGMGLVLLTPFVAEGDGVLTSIFPNKPLITRTLWIVAPEDLFRIRRVRCVWDHIREIVALRPDLFRK
ncbi:LysR family transcriptional regulator [Burkholderia sp. BCC1993]|uniref:LysR family transcriptional regulator n=1 Tax=Burkholderia sp. BCC1993 TaxID=2817444 RepID=UPI002AB2CD56|nr:LysR family transcriptional regulator [Burkholderia sp. BCC1993]